MHWKNVADNWTAFLDRIAQRWPAVDRELVAGLDGNRDAFVEHLAEVTALDRAEADAEVAAWLEGEMPADVQMDETRDNANIRMSERHIPPGEDVYSEDADFGDDDRPAPPVGRSD